MNRDINPAAASSGSRHWTLKLLASVVALVTLTGCAQKIVKKASDEVRLNHLVSQRMVLTERNPTYKPENDQRFILPEPFPDNRLPVYPTFSAEMKPLSDEIVITVTLIFNKDGRVVDTKFADEEISEPMAAFLRQVRLACGSWNFTPLQVRSTKVVPDGEVFGQRKVKVITEVENLPFSLDYEFVFSERAVVRSAQKSDLNK